jgi:hypothetical protein
MNIHTLEHTYKMFKLENSSKLIWYYYSNWNGLFMYEYPIQYKNFIVLGKVEKTPVSNHDTWQK